VSKFVSSLRLRVSLLRRLAVALYFSAVYLAACHLAAFLASSCLALSSRFLPISRALLGAKVLLTPKCHPEIAGRGIEYAWGYAKLRYRSHYNDGRAENHLLTKMSTTECSRVCKCDIEHITKVFKTHRSALDADHCFISCA
jgi:hypothetical protein